MAPRQGVLIGLGGIATQAHLPGFLNGDGIPERLRIVGTLDQGPGAGPLPGIPHFENREQVVEFSAVDFIDVCTPTRTHLDLTLWGLETGYDVLCEKPVALSTADVAAIRRAAGDRQVVMACHQYRYNPAWRALRSWLDQGAIGEWYLAEIQVYRAHADRGASTLERPWRGTREAAGGGVLLDHGTHYIYQLLDVGGMPGSVQSWLGRLHHKDYEVEDTAQVMLEFPERLATLFFTWAGGRRESTIRFTGPDGTIEWAGGMLRLRGRHGPLDLDFSAELDKSRYFAWFAELFHEFADRIERRDGATPLDDIARVTRILEASYQSHSEGCRIALQ